MSDIEALLRPPVELWTAVVAAVAAIICLVFSSHLMMPPTVAQGTAAILLTLAGLRTWQAGLVIRYQRNLRRLPEYCLKPEEIPVSANKMFLGLGFRWNQTHTQRLYNTRIPKYAKYLEPSHPYKLARRIELRLEHVNWMCWFVKLLGSHSAFNPVRPLPPVGGTPALHGVEPCESNVYGDVSERVAHTLVLGTTRVGKTRLAECLITQDIHRGDIVIVFDPKGDKELMMRMYAEAKRCGREDEFSFIHLGHPEISARYNPVASFGRITEIASRISGQLSAEGNSAAFREFAWRFTNIIARAMVELGQKPDYKEIARHVRNIEPLLAEYCYWWFERAAPAGWEKSLEAEAAGIDQDSLPMNLRGKTSISIAIVQYIQKAGLYDPVADGLLSAFNYDKTYFDKIVASLLPLLEKLTTGRVSELLSPDYADMDDDRPILDWMQVIRRRGIVYVGLDALSDSEVAAVVGNSMFADLTSISGFLYKHGRFHGLPGINKKSAMPGISIHADEFNELIGDEFIPLLNKAGGAGFQVTAYTQTWSDVEARIGSASKAAQIAGNMNSLIMLRVKENATAELLTNQLAKVKVTAITAVSGVTDIADPDSDEEFISRNEDRIAETEVDMLTPPDLIQLPKGQAFALINGGQLYKIRIPLPYAGHDSMMPKDIYEIADEVMS
ncbi:MAG: type IV conjugative transfer system coupling protein TraD [Mariprofundales bacterium]